MGRVDDINTEHQRNDVIDALMFGYPNWEEFVCGCGHTGGSDKCKRVAVFMSGRRFLIMAWSNPSFLLELW
jgi:hypothetical protein